jgi:hypothetical protein
MVGLFGGGDAVVGKIGDPPMPGYTDILIDRTTIFGNQYRLSKYSRHTAIGKFVRDAEQLLIIDCEFTRRVHELKARYDAGEKLRFLCHCAPKGCHGEWYRSVCLGRVKFPKLTWKTRK